MDIIKQLIGRLHPLIVHLPIGFIILGLLLQWYDRKKKELQKIIGLVFLWGGIVAILACISGYLLYQNEGYAYDTIKTHLWFGIATATFSLLMYIRIQKTRVLQFFKRIPILFFSAILLLLVSFTGHLGGNITHGETYLIEPLPNSIKSILGYKGKEEKVVLDEETWQEAQLYDDVIQPILNNKCISCHDRREKKGGLQLDTKENILKGGKDGEVLKQGDPKNSMLYANLILPKDDDKHMPPKEKPQLTKEEITLIGTWIENGHPFDKSIGELSLNKELFLSFFPKKPNDDFPLVALEAAPQDSIKKIKQNGIHVEKISEKTNLLQVSCINKPSFTDQDFNLLKSLNKNITLLDLGGTRVTDAIIEKLAALPNLTVLKLDNTAITGKNMDQLQNLEYLRVLNLSGSKFRAEYLEKLSKFKKLQSVYLYNSDIKENEKVKTFHDGQITIDYGNYQLPVMASDSIIY